MARQRTTRQPRRQKPKKNPRRISFAELEREKQASRDADARDLVSGRKSPEELSRENGVVRGGRWRVDFRSAKRLW